MDDILMILVGERGTYRIPRDKIVMIDNDDWNSFVHMLFQSARDKGLDLEVYVHMPTGDMVFEWRPRTNGR